MSFNTTQSHENHAVSQVTESKEDDKSAFEASKANENLFKNKFKTNLTKKFVGRSSSKKIKKKLSNSKVIPPTNKILPKDIRKSKEFKKLLSQSANSNKKLTNLAINLNDNQNKEIQLTRDLMLTYYDTAEKNEAYKRICQEVADSEIAVLNFINQKTGIEVEDIKNNINTTTEQYNSDYHKNQQEIISRYNKATSFANEDSQQQLDFNNTSKEIIKQAQIDQPVLQIKY